MPIDWHTNVSYFLGAVFQSALHWRSKFFMLAYIHCFPKSFVNFLTNVSIKQGGDVALGSHFRGSSWNPLTLRGNKIKCGREKRVGSKRNSKRLSVNLFYWVSSLRFKWTLERFQTDSLIIYSNLREKLNQKHTENELYFNLVWNNNINYSWTSALPNSLSQNQTRRVGR